METKKQLKCRNGQVKWSLLVSGGQHGYFFGEAKSEQEALTQINDFIELLSETDTQLQIAGQQLENKRVAFDAHKMKLDQNYNVLYLNGFRYFAK